jgi:hypothetical protein
MAQYLGLKSLSNLTWLKVYNDFMRARFIIRVEHRGIFIKDIISYEDEKSLTVVTCFIIRLQKEVNYYLDAIWC